MATFTHCNTLQYTATQYNTPQYTTKEVAACTRCNTLLHTATRFEDGGNLPGLQFLERRSGSALLLHGNPKYSCSNLNTHPQPQTDGMFLSLFAHSRSRVL